MRRWRAIAALAAVIVVAATVAVVWWWAPPGVCVAALGTGLALLNFGLDEFINPRLRIAGFTGKAARKAGIYSRTATVITPVMRKSAIPPTGAMPADAVKTITKAAMM